MSDPAIPTPMLTTTARRVLASSMVHAANAAVDGMLVVDALDAVSSAILRVSGLDDPAALAVLSWLWTERGVPPMRGTESFGGDE
jgi:hypothetical protein